MAGVFRGRNCQITDAASLNLHRIIHIVKEGDVSQLLIVFVDEMGSWQMRFQNRASCWKLGQNSLSRCPFSVSANFMSGYKLEPLWYDK